MRLISKDGLSRNSDTGEASLKITPVNGNKVLYEIGESTPSTGSLDIAETKGGYSGFTSSDMRISFVCIDDRDEHEQGEILVWQNTLQLKHEVVQQGDQWTVEFKAVPNPAEIRYTTDGSDPASLGAIYDSLFQIPTGCRFVQAIAIKEGIQSGIERIDMEQYRQKKVVIEPLNSLTWKTQSQGTMSAKAVFDFIERLIKYEGVAHGIIIDVFANDDSASVSYSAEATARFSGEQIKKILEKLQAVMEGSQVSLSVEQVKFEKGQQLIDWLAEIGRQVQPGEIAQ